MIPTHTLNTKTKNKKVLQEALGDDIQKQWYQIELRPFDDEEDRDDQPVESK